VSASTHFANGFPLGTGLVAPWFSPFAELEELGGTPHVQDGIYRSLDFGERTVFDQIRAKVVLSFFNTTPVFTITPIGNFRSAQQAFRHCIGPAIVSLGEPTKLIEDDRYPGAQWTEGPFEVRLGVGNRFTDHFTLTVSRTDWPNNDLLIALEKRRRSRLLVRVVAPIAILLALAAVWLLHSAA